MNFPDIKGSLNETAETLLTDIGSLIIHRHVLNGSVFSSLINALEAILACDQSKACREYYALTSAIVRENPRRVSGNIFSDYILHAIIEVENDFSRMAARGFLDEFVYKAMTHDLEILLPLTQRMDEKLHALYERIGQPVPRIRQGDDKISQMADAAWGGALNRPIKNSQAEPLPAFTPKPMERQFVSWHYGEFELRDSYVADAALEEIYIRCLSRRPTELTEDLWNFFNSYGTGAFLKSRAFYVEENRLAPMQESAFLPKEPPHLCDKIRRQAVGNVISFMRGDGAQNMLVCGGRGIGKTTMTLSILNELPEVRLLYIRGEQAEKSLVWALDEIASQPLKFLIVIDDVEDADKLKRIESLLLGGARQPENALIYAITAKATGAPLFPYTLSLEYPSLNEYAELIHALLNKRGLDMEFAAIHNACMDYQLETRLPLSYAAVWPIMRELESPENDDL